MTNEEMIEKLTELVIRSEIRIDTTNKMISKLVDLCELQSRLHEDREQRQLHDLLARAMSITDNLSKTPPAQITIYQQ